MRALSWLILLLFIAGCGYKGPLKLPEPAQASAQQLPQKQ